MEKRHSLFSQVIYSILWNQKVHYRVQNSPIISSCLSQMNLVHAHPFIYFKIHFNIPSSAPRSSKWSLSYRFPPHFSSPPHVPSFHLFHTLTFGYQNNTRWGLPIMKLPIMQFRLVSTYLFHLPSYGQISFSAPSSQTLSVYIVPLR